jgi:predicted glycosyltransferase
MRVMIVVTHLLGTGHLARALTLGRALLAAGEEVRLVSGGMPAPLLDAGAVPLVQLPPVRSDGVNFASLLGEAGQPVGEDVLAARRARLLAELRSFRPEVVVTELFPFGRRILRGEFEALLAEAGAQRPRPLICASIRDILAPPSKPRKLAYADEMLTAHYDALLVHSDPALMPLEASWPLSEAIRARLHYTGFVAPAPAQPAPKTPGAGEILVAAGGGPVGAPLFAAARAAAALRPDWRWRLLIGGAEGAARAAEMAAGALPNLRAEAARPDYRAMLHRAAASLSLCGYNTALDVLQARVPALFVPFDAGSEVEQGIRARQLARQPGIATLTTAELSPDRLVASLEEVMGAPRRAPLTEGLAGAARSASLLRTLWEARA